MNTIGTVQMLGPPNGYSKQISKFQPKAHDGAGAPYIYNKSPITRVTHDFFYSRQSVTTRDALITQFEVVDGMKTPFTWADHADAGHTVRYATGSLLYKRADSDTWNISFSLEEDL